MHSLQIGITHVLQKNRRTSALCLEQLIGFSTFRSSLLFWSSFSVITRWPSKQCMNWWAITQFGHRKLAQSKQRATAFNSLLLQPVHVRDVLSRALASRMLLMAKSGLRPCTPAVVRYVSASHEGHWTLSGDSKIFSKHGWQNVWKQDKTLGMVYVSWQRLHLVFTSLAGVSVSPSVDELDAELVTVSVLGVGEDMVDSNFIQLPL